MNNIPKNYNECEHTNTCKSAYYGGLNYRARAPFKGNPEQDMRKADEYLELAKRIADTNPTVSPITLIKEKE